MDNDINMNMAGKVVSVLIALLFIVVLVFPIANSLSNGGNGGGGDSGDSEKIILNTFESSIGADLTPYNSFQYYDSSITPSLPHEITYTLEDLNEISFIESDFGEESNIPILEAYDDSRNGVNIGYDVEDEEINVVIMHNGSGGGPWASHLTSFNLTISTDYSLDCSYTYEYPAGSDPVTESIQVTVTGINQLSESEDGWMSISWELHNDRIAVGSDLMLGIYIESIDKEWYKVIRITEDMISDNHLQFTVDWGDGYTSDVDLELQSTDTAGVWKFTDSLSGWYGTVKDNGVELDPNDSYCWFAYISTYGYIQSDSSSDSTGSGGGMASGVGGVAGTLIKLVPILLIVGLLMTFIVPMVYKPN